MADWSSDLSEALASGDRAQMQAMLATLPDDILHMALPYLEQLAHGSANVGKLALSLAYYDCLVHVAPGRVDWQADRVRILVGLERHRQALEGAVSVARLAPESALGYCLQADVHQAAGRLPDALAALRQAARCEPDDDVIAQRIGVLEAGLCKDALAPDARGAPPKAGFDPALFDDPSLPPSCDSYRVDGLRQHLRRRSAQLSPRNAIARLEDPLWRAAWDTALACCAGEKLLFRGSELGVLALRALHHGAAQVCCAETYALDARIATGMAQKYFLTQWHAQHSEAIAGWSAEQRRASFEAFAAAIDIVAGGAEAAPAMHADCLVFPHIDHTLLGTGIAAAVRQFCSGTSARVLPARATIFAMGIEWNYPGAPWRLEPMNALRWSMQAQALELGPEFWHARTATVECGRIDFADFSQQTWELALPVSGDGAIDAIVFWFDLDMGAACLSNRPGSALQCILPAVQYVDRMPVRAGSAVALRVRIDETRLFFQTMPPAALQRSFSLPSWYVPMLGDRCRTEAYGGAIAAALAEQPAALVLDIGSGCGLLSMMAVQAGAQKVVACETHPAILEAGRQIVAGNGMQDRIAMVGKDCRKLTVPDDLPARAELALFELFDCSLIGEGILHFLAHARAHLLAEGARYLPAAAKIRAVVIEYRLDRLWDLDASLLNPYRGSPAFTGVDASTLPHRTLSEPFDVFAFDFASAGPAPQQKLLRPLATDSGMAGALLFWFDLRLDATRWISNVPRRGKAPHWKQGLQILPELRVEAGNALALLARHDGSALEFQWNKEELDHAALSPVPRFDPRWLAANADLERQTRSLLQRCSQSHDEYQKVADIAKRFAVDPGAHQLDPAIAQRFASIFLN
jgi:protein arginine N-methyltransferase 7